MRRRRKTQTKKDEYPQPEIVQGEVIERKPNALFVIRLDDGRVLSSCYLPPFVRYHAKFFPEVGDQVWVEPSPYDADRGRIGKRILTKQKPEQQKKDTIEGYHQI